MKNTLSIRKGSFCTGSSAKLTVMADSSSFKLENCLLFNYTNIDLVSNLYPSRNDKITLFTKNIIDLSPLFFLIVSATLIDLSGKTVSSVRAFP